MSSSKAISSLASSSCSLCLRRDATSRFVLRSLAAHQPTSFRPRYLHTPPTTSTPASSSSSSSPSTSSSQLQAQSQQRQFTSSSIPQQEATLAVKQKTPPVALGAEFGYRDNKAKRPTNVGRTRKRKPYSVNESLERLNEAYVKLLGEGGDKGLPDDLKWQCVTHKSFDHGMQPFNEKLAFFGRRITYLHTTLSMLNASPSVRERSIDDLERELGVRSGLPSRPFTNTKQPQLKNLSSISYVSVDSKLQTANLVAIASVTGITQCLRWKPRDAYLLDESGMQDVAKGAIFAIVGAIGLHRGAEAARRVVVDRILSSFSGLKPEERE